MRHSGGNLGNKFKKLFKLVKKFLKILPIKLSYPLPNALRKIILTKWNPDKFLIISKKTIWTKGWRKKKGWGMAEGIVSPSFFQKLLNGVFFLLQISVENAPFSETFCWNTFFPNNLFHQSTILSVSRGAFFVVQIFWRQESIIPLIFQRIFELDTVWAY